MGKQKEQIRTDGTAYAFDFRYIAPEGVKVETITVESNSEEEGLNAAVTLAQKKNLRAEYTGYFKIIKQEK